MRVSWVRTSILLFVAILLATFSEGTRSDPRTVKVADTRLKIEVVDVDDPARIDMLARWAEQAARATVLPSGRFPLTLAKVRIREIDSGSSSPVPWGQTWRDDPVEVLLYVRRGATEEQLRADWTAVHEFSHLAHPYLGNRGRWLAEGLASYHQNLLRARAGLLTPEEAWRRLDAGFRRGQAVGVGPALSDLSQRRGGTMRIYWAGAAFWLEMDLALRDKHRTTLLDVLDKHARCCLNGTAHVAPKDFLAALDRAGGVDLFANRYHDYADATSFPSLEASYRTLGIERDGNEIVFSPEPAARARRQAMTMPATPVQIQKNSDDAATAASKSSAP